MVGRSREHVRNAYTVSEGWYKTHHNLGLLDAVAQGKENRREEESQSVSGSASGGEAESPGPDPPFTNELTKLAPSEFIDVGVTTVALDAIMDPLSLLSGQEFVLLREVDDHFSAY